MSENLKTDTNEAIFCDGDDQAGKYNELAKSELITSSELHDVVYDKQQLLVERANTTFQELCKTLESEQTKLLELEEKRKKLQEEMLLLKAEIEEEKQLFSSNITQSIAENLNALNNHSNTKVCDGNQHDESIEISFCGNYEEEEQVVTARNLGSKTSQESSVEDHAKYIRSELHNVLSQCIAEKCE